MTPLSISLKLIVAIFFFDNYFEFDFESCRMTKVGYTVFYFSALVNITDAIRIILKGRVVIRTDKSRVSIRTYNNFWTIKDLQAIFVSPYYHPTIW